MYPKKVTSTIAREGGFLKPHHWFILSPKIDTSYDESMAVFLWTMINHPYCQSYITGVGEISFHPLLSYNRPFCCFIPLSHNKFWIGKNVIPPIFFTNKPSNPIGFLGALGCFPNRTNRTSGRQRGSTTTGPSRKPTAWARNQLLDDQGVGVGIHQGCW